MNFVLGGAEGMAAGPEVDWEGQFRMLDGETLAGLLERYDTVAQKTSEIVASLPDLNQSHPLPVAPWFEPGASWSARRVLLHIIAETAQHAGHADIIRESLDGPRPWADAALALVSRSPSLARASTRSTRLRSSPAWRPGSRAPA